MSLSQTSSDSAGRARGASFHPFRVLKRLMPRRLFGRSLIIIVAPMLLLQAVVTTVFFDRHYRITTAVMTRGVANDISYMVMLESQLPPGPARDAARTLAAKTFGYSAEFKPSEHLTRTVSQPATVLDRQLAYVFGTQLTQPATFDTTRSRTMSMC